ncbi:MAG: monofunctional biosynthetic peptidoglycan transglycosylase [Dysgonomonas sp.]
MKRFFKWVRNIIIGLFLFSLLQVITFKFIPVYFTPLMIIRSIEQKSEGKDIKWEHKWVSIDKISPYLPQAVVASEDNLFLDHSGFDFNQIEKAREEAEKGKRLRGASTISQQTAKNVFLWNGKSYIRKGLEAYYTLLIELIWGKKRIMEVYLNSIEMGDGIYGAEAVAKNHFNKTAEKLTRDECALIAATLPNPRKFNSAKPSKYILKRKNQIISLMGKIKPVEFE